MAEFLVTTAISSQIEDIIINADEKLILVSPYLQLSKNLLQRLKDASQNKVPIKIIYGKDELKQSEKDSLSEIPNLEIYFLENLHAKCYLNEKKMVITSMNMYEYSEKTNREMGVQIDAISDKSLYDKAFKEVHSIIQHSERKYWNGKSSKNTEKVNSYAYSRRGFCIRCEADIPYNREIPYCYNCYQTWNNFQNYHYEENVCHSCGKAEDATMMKPQCYNCYSS